MSTTVAAEQALRSNLAAIDKQIDNAKYMVGLFQKRAADWESQLDELLAIRVALTTAARNARKSGASK